MTKKTTESYCLFLSRPELELVEYTELWRDDSIAFKGVMTQIFENTLLEAVKSGLLAADTGVEKVVIWLTEMGSGDILLRERTYKRICDKFERKIYSKVLMIELAEEVCEYLSLTKQLF